MLTLDSLSLLLSKQNPTTASATLSQELRDMVGIGTIGVDKLHETLKSTEMKKNQENVAMGWTLMEINKIKEASEEASKFLQKEMDLENTYWEDVIKVQESGWSICKMPQDRSSLAVRFGFSESIPEFQRSGLAHMKRGEDGRVQLDVGALGRVPKRLRVTIEKDGKIVGQSALPAGTDEQTPLQARVLEARDTIFARELWHELVRESRQLLSYDVQLTDGVIICKTDSSYAIKLQLVDLQMFPSLDTSLSDNEFAESILMSLNLLLSYAHRYNELTRTRPMPPHISRSHGPQTYALLRPIIARLRLQRDIKSVTTYTGVLLKALKQAGLPASFTMQTPALTWEPSGGLASNRPNQAASAQSLILNLLQPQIFSLQVSYLPEISFAIRGKTLLYPVTVTQFSIQTSPDSKLSSICPPYKDGYKDATALKEYLYASTSQVLAAHYLNTIRASGSQLSGGPKPDEGQSKRQPDWNQTVRASHVRDFSRDGREIFFLVEPDEAECVLTTGFVNQKQDGTSEAKRWKWHSNMAEKSEEKKLDEVVDVIIEEMKL